MEKYIYRLAMRWADADTYGHVNNALFLRYMEEARTRMLQAMLPHEEAERRQRAFVVRRSVVDYHAPLVYRDESVDVQVWVIRSRAATLELGYQIQDDDRLYAEATTTLAAYNLDTGSPRRISEHEKNFLARFTEA